MPHQGIEPASATCRSYALPTEPHPTPHVRRWYAQDSIKDDALPDFGMLRVAVQCVILQMKSRVLLI